MVPIAPRARPCYAVREVINVDNDMQLLLSRLAGLIADEPDVDLVPTKFGWVFLTNTVQQGIVLELRELLNFEKVAAVFVDELDCQVAAKHGWRDMTQEDAEELRALAALYLEDLEKKEVAYELLEKLIAKALEITAGMEKAARERAAMQKAYHDNPPN